MSHTLRTIFWNVRGLNNRAKRTAIRSVIYATAPSIVCLQETKLSLVSSTIVAETLGDAFRDYYWLPADGTRGGIILAWRADHVSLSNRSMGVYHVFATILPTSGGDPWWITGVYRPQSDAAKIEFLGKLHDLRSTMARPWVIGGDFNMISLTADKNNDRVNHRMMNRFRRLISNLALRDIYLHGCRYTWFNEQANPTLVKNDRVLCTPSWEQLHPHNALRCLASTISDHCPLPLAGQATVSL